MGQLPNNDIPMNRAHLTQQPAYAKATARQGERIMETTREKCGLCGKVGANGAKWLIETSDGKIAYVHKPCGEKLVATAPPEAKARLLPSRELKAEWAAKRVERQAKDFWAERCPQLLEIKKGLE